MQTAVAHDAPAGLVARQRKGPLLSGPSDAGACEGSGAVALLEFLLAAAGAGIVAAYGLERIAHRLVAVVAVRTMDMTMDMTMAMIVMMIVVVVAVRAVYVGFLTHGGPILG